MPFHPDQLLLYAVTDGPGPGGQTLLEQLEAALQGGVTLSSSGKKTWTQPPSWQRPWEVKALCRRYHVPLILNDQVDLALACGADGVHVGSEDLPVAHIRRRAGPDFIIGATAKTVQQAQAAQAAGANYLGVGAVFPSPTKPGAQRLTPEELGGICASVSIPAVAIGRHRPKQPGPVKGVRRGGHRRGLQPL